MGQFSMSVTPDFNSSVSWTIGPALAQGAWLLDDLRGRTGGCEAFGTSGCELYIHGADFSGSPIHHAESHHVGAGLQLKFLVKWQPGDHDLLISSGTECRIHRVFCVCSEIEVFVPCSREKIHRRTLTLVRAVMET